MLMDKEEIYFDKVKSVEIFFLGSYIKVFQLIFDKGIVYGIL